MDQAQLENFNKIQALTQEFLKDGFVSDTEPAIPQPLLNLPIMAQQAAPPIQEELAPGLNRPNSTLERAAPFIRSLGDE